MLSRSNRLIGQRLRQPLWRYNNYTRQNNISLMKNTVTFATDSSSPMSEPLEDWPISKSNFIINFCQQGESIVVEQLGKFSYVQEAGPYLLIPGKYQSSFIIIEFFFNLSTIVLSLFFCYIIYNLNEIYIY